MEQELNLKILTPEIDYAGIQITSKDINRPGIQLTGYLEHFDKERIEVIGYVEAMYLESLKDERKQKIYSDFLGLGMPCVIFCRGLLPDQLFLKKAVSLGIPVFSVNTVTSIFMSEIIRWLNTELAPVVTIHGCLVDIYGVGVFIRGESGIGKSEATLELVKRGHRIVADDAVEIHKVSEFTLFGKAPYVIKDFIEIRGIGIVDIKTLFGVQSIKETQTIDLVVTLEEWDQYKDYERLGTEEKYIEILGNQVVNYELPVRPGRNLAVILEAAAVNYRQKQLGYDATKAFLDRVNHSFDQP